MHGHSLRLDGDYGSRIAPASTAIALHMHGAVTHVGARGLVAGQERAHGLRSAHELRMTIYAEGTECHYGGYGAGRVGHCLATRSKAKKHRVFVQVTDFIRELKDVLHALTTAQVDEDRTVSP